MILESVKKNTVKKWVDSWLCDLIRADNRTLKSIIMSVGLGKTTRLLKTRNDFHLLDDPIKNSMAKAYVNSKNRIFIIDNEVILP